MRRSISTSKKIAAFGLSASMIVGMLPASGLAAVWQDEGQDWNEGTRYGLWSGNMWYDGGQNEYVIDSRYGRLNFEELQDTLTVSNVSEFAGDWRDYDYRDFDGTWEEQRYFFVWIPYRWEDDKIVVDQETEPVFITDANDLVISYFGMDVTFARWQIESGNDDIRWVPNDTRTATTTKIVETETEGLFRIEDAEPGEYIISKGALKVDKHKQGEDRIFTNSDAAVGLSLRLHTGLSAFEPHWEDEKWVYDENERPRDWVDSDENGKMIRIEKEVKGVQQPITVNDIQITYYGEVDDPRRTIHNDETGEDSFPKPIETNAYFMNNSEDESGWLFMPDKEGKYLITENGLTDEDNEENAKLRSQGVVIEVRFHTGLSLYELFYDSENRSWTLKDDDDSRNWTGCGISGRMYKIEKEVKGKKADISSKDLQVTYYGKTDQEPRVSYYDAETGTEKFLESIATKAKILVNSEDDEYFTFIPDLEGRYLITEKGLTDEYNEDNRKLREEGVVIEVRMDCCGFFKQPGEVSFFNHIRDGYRPDSDDSMRGRWLEGITRDGPMYLYTPLDEQGNSTFDFIEVWYRPYDAEEDYDGYYKLDDNDKIEVGGNVIFSIKPVDEMEGWYEIYIAGLKGDLEFRAFSTMVRDAWGYIQFLRQNERYISVIGEDRLRTDLGEFMVAGEEYRIFMLFPGLITEFYSPEELEKFKAYTKEDLGWFNEETGQFEYFEWILDDENRYDRQTGKFILGDGQLLYPSDEPTALLTPSDLIDVSNEDGYMLLKIKGEGDALCLWDGDDEYGPVWIGGVYLPGLGIYSDPEDRSADTIEFGGKVYQGIEKQRYVLAWVDSDFEKEDRLRAPYATKFSTVKVRAAKKYSFYWDDETQEDKFEELKDFITVDTKHPVKDENGAKIGYPVTFTDKINRDFTLVLEADHYGSEEEYGRDYWKLDYEYVPLVGLGVTVDPDKTSYLVGEKFDPAGLELSALYEDGEVFVLDPGQYTVTIDNEDYSDHALTLDDTMVALGFCGTTAYVEIKVDKAPGKEAKPAEIMMAMSDAVSITCMDSFFNIIYGQEYVIAKKGEKPDWTKAKRLEGTEGTIDYENLTPATEYVIYARTYETDTAYAGKPVKTAYVTPLDGVGHGCDTVVGQEIVLDIAPEDATGLTYQWYYMNVIEEEDYTRTEVGAKIKGATGRSYTPVKKDIGKYLYVKVFKGKTEVGDHELGYVEPATYTVTFDANGGTNAPKAKTKKRGEDLEIALTDKQIPTREGYFCVGFAKDKNAKKPDYTIVYPFTYEDDEDVTLYAVWQENPFEDCVKTSWYTRYVGYASFRGAMTGYSSEPNFGVADPLLRCEMITLLWKLDGQPKVKTSDAPFPDVTGGYYKKACIWGKNKGITTGRSDGNFYPLDNISRQEFVVMLYRYAQAKGLDVSVKNKKAYLEKADAAAVASWAKTEVNWGYVHGLIGNGSDLKPGDDITRAEAATIIARFIVTYGL